MLGYRKKVGGEKEERKLTQERLKELLDYNPETGVFLNKISRRGNARMGEQAGFIGPEGYILIGLDWNTYKAARLAFLYMTGKWPANTVEHKNRNRADDSWDNLADVTIKENNQNKECHQNNPNLGVYRDQRGNLYCAFKINGKSTRVGSGFKTLEDAQQCALQFRQQRGY